MRYFDIIDQKIKLDVYFRIFSYRYKRDETDVNDQDPSVDYDILSKVFRNDEE